MVQRQPLLSVRPVMIDLFTWRDQLDRLHSALAYSADNLKLFEAQRKQYHRKVQIKYKYGLKWDQYNQMVRDQNGRCYICKELPNSKGLNVDHCHKSGKVRRLLCSRCNTAMGAIDNVELLPKLMAYAREHSER